MNIFAKEERKKNDSEGLNAVCTERVELKELGDESVSFRIRKIILSNRTLIELGYHQPARKILQASTKSLKKAQEPPLLTYTYVTAHSFN